MSKIMWGLGSNEFQLKWHLKKLKSWVPFWSYQLNCSANSAHLARFLVNGLDWQYCFASSSKTAPKILISSIAMGADYSFIET